MPKLTMDPTDGTILSDGEPVGHLGIMMPGFCPRECTDCTPLASLITVWDDDKSKRQYTCVGENDGTNRVVPGDELRHCFKNDEIDQKQDWDQRDVVDTVSVLMQGLSLHTNKKLNQSTKGPKNA